MKTEIVEDGVKEKRAYNLNIQIKEAVIYFSSEPQQYVESACMAVPSHNTSKIVTAYILSFCVGLLLTFYFLQKLCGSCMLLLCFFSWAPDKILGIHYKRTDTRFITR